MTDSIIVFGASGQLGRALSRAAPPDGCVVRGFDRAAVDITQLDEVNRALDDPSAALVVNAAAFTAVDAAEDAPAQAYAVNRDGPALIAAACALRGLPLVHISTDYVFDGTKRTPYREDDPVAPIGIYGASKEAGERAVRAAHDRHIILRTSWVFSADGSNFVKTMLRLAESRETLSVVDDQAGCPTPADELAEAVMAIAARLRRDAPATAFGTYHYCGQGAVTWCGFARAIFTEAARCSGRRVPRVQPITTADYPARAARPANSVLDCARIEARWGIVQRPWREGLARVVERLAATTEAIR